MEFTWEGCEEGCALVEFTCVLVELTWEGCVLVGFTCTCGIYCCGVRFQIFCNTPIAFSLYNFLLLAFSSAVLYSDISSCDKVQNPRTGRGNGCYVQISTTILL